MGDLERKVFAVVVTYAPQLQPLTDLITALVHQVEQIIVVDNTPIEDRRVEQLVADLLFPSISISRLGGNLGVAKALNVGIQHALDAGAGYVLLSDQDSLPARDMVAGLLRSFDELTALGYKVGAIGPTFTDLYTGTTFSFQANVDSKFFYGHVSTTAQKPFVEAISLITSGTLIPTHVFESSGKMAENLFIDKVDIEWCHRARAAGFHLFGTAYASMFQRLGDATLRVWYFGWRKESVYSPTRVYYQVRNFFALCKAPYIPLRWKVRNAWYTFGVVYSQAIFGKAKIRSIAMTLRGVFDGISGRMGSLD